jgi:hypothetical protein
VKVEREGNISEKLWEFPVVARIIFTYFSVSMMEKVMHLAVCYSRRGTIAVRDYCLVEREQRTWWCVAISYLQQMSAVTTWLE